ncbi:outer membrane beta-barrel protein [Pseudomonas lurida]|uniref:outer membrane beta-barrel protein n=1 Tax=Pseudomonas lurida TaxID=244566 RepID=UPI003BB4953D
MGLNIKPPMPKVAGALLVRPEIRYDWSLNDTTPFAAGTRGHQLTVAADVILMF